MRDRPVLHGRDHAPGGADPTLFLWDDVGTGGGSGTWSYATPVAPATAPAGAGAGQPFLGSWANIALRDGSYSPLRYRLTAGDCELEGAIGGGTFGTPAVQLPAGYAPLDDVYKVVASTDATTSLICLIDTGGFLIPQARSALGSAKVTVTSGSLTTTSTSFVDATGVLVSLTTFGGTRALVSFVGGGRTTSANNDVSVDLTVDGARQGQTVGLVTVTDAVPAATGYNLNLSFTYLTDVLPAGTHTFQLQWRVGAGTGTLFAATAALAAVLSAVEMAA